MRYILILALWAVAFPAWAGTLEFTEIMYDVEGADGSREWFEVRNGGSEPVDLTLHRLFEGGTNHVISAVSENNLPPGTFAVIVDDLQKFKVDWPSYTGLLFESSFSLSNTGETLVLKDQSLVSLDAVTYGSSAGGAGNGMSIQKDGGSWIAAHPTPGRAAIGKGIESSASPQEKTTEKTTVEPIAVELLPDIDRPHAIRAGENAFFKASAKLSVASPVGFVQYVWNMGDGTVREGASVLHVYDRPGAYVIVLTASNEYLSTVLRETIEVIEPGVRIASVALGLGGYIEVTNEATVELNLSGWSLRGGEQMFLFPYGTILLPKATIAFAAKTTRLSLIAPIADLVYPNGKVAFHYSMLPTQAVRPSYVSTARPISGTTAANNIQTALWYADDKNVVTTATDTETATVALAAAVKGSKAASPYLWYALFIVLIGGSVGVVFWLGRRSSKEEFTLIDHD